jgi:hypothetical protein
MGMCWSEWRYSNTWDTCLRRTTLTSRQSAPSCGKPEPLGLVRVWQVLRAENVPPRVAAKFYKAVVQAVILNGSKTWVLSTTACGLHHSLSADDHGVRGNPPDSKRMQAGRAEEGSSTAPLVVGATYGPGRQRCNWIIQVMVRSKSHPAVQQQGMQEDNWARQPSCSVATFSCGEYLCWVRSDGIL